MGIPTYKLKLFKEVFLEKFKTKKTPDKNKDETKEERIIAVTTRELCDYYKEKTRKTITSNNLKQNYLNEFINNGLIDEEDSVIDNRVKIYHPIVDLPDDGKETEISPYDRKISSLSILERMDNILQHPLLLVPKRFKYIPGNWLELEIIDLLRYPSIIGRFELYDQENERLCICRFVELYQKAQMIDGYFSNALFYNTYNEIFGQLQNLNWEAAQQCKKISIDVEMDKKDILNGKGKEIELRAVRNNIAYAQIIRNNHLYQDFVDGSKSDPSTNNEVRDAKQSVENFFLENTNDPWQPSPKHGLEQSPCNSILEECKIKATQQVYYRYKLHPDVWSIDLSYLEHHCKYQEREAHKDEILRHLRSSKGSSITEPNVMQSKQSSSV